MELTREDKLDQLWDTLQIKNLMGKYEYYHTEQMKKKVLQLFALDTEGVSVEVKGLGTFEGADEIDKFFSHAYHTFDGRWHEAQKAHLFTAEVIEIAQDGKNAAGLWLTMPGIDKGKSPKSNDELEVNCSTGRYSVDFIKIDNEWKLWHFLITDPYLCKQSNFL